MDNENKKQIVIVFTVADIILFIIFVIGITYIIQYFNASKSNKQAYEQISNDVQTAEINIGTESEENIQYSIPENVQKVINLKQENQEVIGWVQIDNTNINYPILQGSDNKYYLTHNYKKEDTKYGSIYIKSNSSLTSKDINTIIYGHNMKDSQMFNNLIKYENIDFYNEHPIIKIATETEEKEFQIISVFRSRVFYQNETNVFKYYNWIMLNNEHDYNEYVNNCRQIQLYETNQSANYGEKLITLSTCEYSQANGRFVVVAKEIVR